MPTSEAQVERVRRVHKDFDREEIDRVAAGLPARPEAKAPKPLKAARSKAEITRVRQGYALLCMAMLQFSGTVVLILSQVFNVF